VKLPPLRERLEDIPLLVQHFLDKFGSKAEISPEAMKALTAYPWKGNVRELENVVERAVLLSRGGLIQMHHLPEEFLAVGISAGRPLALEEIERQHIIKVLRIARDFDEASTILGIDPATLWRKRKKFHL
jgi:NtrC-family two-component system response regulator AlgB